MWPSATASKSSFASLTLPLAKANSRGILNYSRSYLASHTSIAREKATPLLCLARIKRSRPYFFCNLLNYASTHMTYMFCPARPVPSHVALVYVRPCVALRAKNSNERVCMNCFSTSAWVKSWTRRDRAFPFPTPSYQCWR